jgi:hypothetical protein
MESTEPPRHNVLYSYFDPKASWFSVMCLASRFQIIVSLKDLLGSRFALEYSQLVAKLDETNDEFADEYCETMCDWILEPCSPRFRECASHIPEGLTLQAFYYPPTHSHGGLLQILQGCCHEWPVSPAGILS